MSRSGRFTLGVEAADDRQSKLATIVEINQKTTPFIAVSSTEKCSSKRKSYKNIFV